MIFADPFDSLTEDYGATFRPQREWVQRRGLLLISAHFLSGGGAGAWLFAVLFAYRPGLFLGLAVVLLGGLAHLAFLGRVERFWRILLRVRSSWISRGLVGVGLFSVCAVLYLLSSSLPGEANPLQPLLLGLSLLGAAWTCVYKGFVWAVAKGIAFWNSALLPALCIAYALRGGMAALFLSLVFTGLTPGVGLVDLTRLWIGVSAATLVFLFLLVSLSTGATARSSVAEVARSKLSYAFYLGDVLFGLVLPVAIVMLPYLTPLALPLLGVIGIFSLVSDFFAMHSIARAGIYRPLLG